MPRFEAPTPEEIVAMERRAQETLTPEQAAMSAERERFFLQERDPFDDFIVHLDAKDERRPPTPEERERQDRRLELLGDLFGDSGVRWHLDGALNISLYAGEYIGVHKDVDVSVFTEDLEALDAAMVKKGYGLFISYPKDPADPKGKKVMERVGPSRFSHDIGHVSLAAIDEKGALRPDDELFIIDTHVIAQEGSAAPFRPDAPDVPKAWFEPNPVEFHGRTINLSHPAKVTYFKLQADRAYDVTDLKRLALTGSLRLEDLDDVKRVLDTEFERQLSRVDQVVGLLTGALRQGMTAEDAEAAMLELPVVQEKLRDAGTREKIRALAEDIAGNVDFGPHVVRASLFRVFEVRKRHDGRDAIIDELRGLLTKETP